MRTILFVIFLFGVNLLAGQISATIISPVDTVDVGQQFTVDLRISKPQNVRFQALDLNPLHNPITLQNALTGPDSSGIYSLPDFELSAITFEGDDDKDLIVPYNLIKWTEDQSLGKSYWERKIDYLFWDPGVYKLDAVDFILSDSTTQVLPLEATTIFVRAPQMDIDTTKQIPVNPIKDIIRESRTWKDFLPYILALLGLLALLYFGYWLRNRRQANLNADLEYVEPYIEPHILAMQKLEVLDQEQLWQKGEVKTYQSRLTNIIREYLNGRFAIPALELSTFEITDKLKKDNRFNNTYEQQLVEILNMADLIKFAKAKPPADIHQRYMDTAIHFVNNTKSIATEEE